MERSVEGRFILCSSIFLFFLSELGGTNRLLSGGGSASVLVEQGTLFGWSLCEGSRDPPSGGEAFYGGGNAILCIIRETRTETFGGNTVQGSAQ